MSAGLGQDALAGVDKQDGQIRCRGTGDHVAGVLLVAWSICQDEAACRGLKEPVGDVDGDALLALRL